MNIALWVVQGLLAAVYLASGLMKLVRSHEQIVAYFAGLELLKPGVVPIHQWRPEPGLVGVPAAVDESGGVGRKPLTPG